MKPADRKVVFPLTLFGIFFRHAAPLRRELWTRNGRLGFKPTIRRSLGNVRRPSPSHSLIWYGSDFVCQKSQLNPVGSQAFGSRIATSRSPQSTAFAAFTSILSPLASSSSDRPELELQVVARPQRCHDPSSLWCENDAQPRKVEQQGRSQSKSARGFLNEKWPPLAVPRSASRAGQCSRAFSSISPLAH